MSDKWNKRTRLVHAGIRRSQYGEVSEPIFLTQGFVYDSAEAAAARFDALGVSVSPHSCVSFRRSITPDTEH